jgi:PAS domain S-box-containing protein
MHRGTKADQFYLGIMDELSEGYIFLDKQWRFRFINRAAEELTGFQRETHIGKSYTELFPERINTDYFSGFRNAMENGQRTEFEYFSPSALRWLRARVVPHEDGIAVFHTDLSAQRQLKDNLTYLEAITHTLNHALITTDQNDRIIRWNSAAEILYGWTSEEVIGKKATEILPALSGQDFYSTLRETLLASGHWSGEIRQRTKYGEEKLIHARLSVLKNTEGELTGFVSLNRDITRARKAEEAQMQLAAIVESSDDAIISKSLDGFITSWNAGAQRIFGYTAEEVIGKHITLLIPKDLEHEENLIIGKVRKGEHVQHFDTERITKDGRRLNISLSVSPVKNANGEIIGASKISRDITEKKKTERAVQASAEQLRAMFNQAGVGVCLLAPDCSIIEVNPKFCAILGYTEYELKEKSFISFTHAEDQLANQRVFDSLLKTKQETATFEKRYVRKNRSQVWVRITIAKIHYENGELRQFVAIVEDITEHKQAEAGLRESESRFRILAENIQNLAWMANPDGWIFWCNQRWYEYLGRSFETIKGWGWENTVHPDHAQRVHTFLMSAWSKGEPWQLTFPLRSKNGEYRLFLTNAYPVRNSSGELQRWIGTCTDVETLKDKL